MNNTTEGGLSAFLSSFEIIEEDVKLLKELLDEIMPHDWVYYVARNKSPSNPHTHNTRMLLRTADYKRLYRLVDLIENTIKD